MFCGERLIKLTNAWARLARGIFPDFRFEIVVAVVRVGFPQFADDDVLGNFFVRGVDGDGQRRDRAVFERAFFASNKPLKMVIGLSSLQVSGF